MPKKNIPIDYTNRDFASIRRSLLQHTKRYYPDTFKDFSEASFGSLMIDTVAYVGDMLSFYLDYQANESFFATAGEYSNVLKLSQFLGYKLNKSPASYGVCQFYALVPAATDGGPDMRYAPILRAGTKVATERDVPYSLMDDIAFADTSNEVVVARVNEDTGAPTYYAVKSEGRVVSGEARVHEVEVEDFERFLTIDIPDTNITEVISISDSEGHIYHEVEHLSQDTIFKPVTNANVKNDSVPNLLKVMSVPRRFSVSHLDTITSVQFGYGSENELVSGSVADPSSIALKRHGKNFISDTTFDPSKLTSTDKFGVSPENTTLRIVYRANKQSNVNAGSNRITRVTFPIVDFVDVLNLDRSVRNFIGNTLEVSNEEPIIGDVTLPNVEEIKLRAMANFAAQNRAVTKQDYISLTYSMPANFGAIKRCTIQKDRDSFKRNLNLFILSEDSDGTLVRSNPTIKRNLRTWLNSARMINDTVDILDARIINYGVKFDIVIDENANRHQALREAQLIVEEITTELKEIGEPLVVSDLFQALKSVPAVVDVADLEVVNKTGAPYSELIFNIKANSSEGGRVITPPPTAILELKYPQLDIEGRIV